MEVLFNGAHYRVYPDPQARVYKTRSGALRRRAKLQARADARPLPNNIYAFSPAGTPATDLGAAADLLRIEALHRGYTAVWNVSQDRPVAGPALVQEWKNAGGRAAWIKENGPRRFKTDKERVAELQRERGERYTL